MIEFKEITTEEELKVVLEMCYRILGNDNAELYGYEAWLIRFKDGLQPLIYACDDDKIVSAVLGRSENKDSLVIGFVACDENHRRQGITKKLMELFEEKAIEEKRNALNHHEIIAVINTEHRAKLAAHIMMFAGLRRGELTALTWDDIDLEKRVICVNKSYNFKSEEVKDTKTDSGERKIPINDSLFNLLQQEKVKAKGKLVIEKVTKGIMTESARKRMLESYEKALRKYREQIKADKSLKNEIFEMFTPHMLRHTYCSMLSWAGVDIKSAQVLMAHSDFSTTANIYTHANEEIKTNAAIMQEDFIKNILNRRNI